MTFCLYEVENLVKNKNYKELELYLENNKEYSYSFLNFLKFMRDEYNIEYLDTIINNYENTNLNKIETVSRKDFRYREDVKEICNNKCVVTGKFLCNEVAHIQEFKDCEYDNDRYCKFNGFYLQDNIHKLWDKYEYLVIDYCNQDQEIFFKINVDKLNIEDNKEEKIKELLEKCFILETEYKNKSLEEIRIHVKINKEYFKEYRYYINKRNNN
jgi:hypothetical protein